MPYDNPALYGVAMQVCHDFGLDYIDPRTGKKYPAPKPATPTKKVKKRKTRKGKK